MPRYNDEPTPTLTETTARRTETTSRRTETTPVLAEMSSLVGATIPLDGCAMLLVGRPTTVVRWPRQHEPTTDSYRRMRDVSPPTWSFNHRTPHPTPSHNRHSGADDRSHWSERRILSRTNQHLPERRPPSGQTRRLRPPHAKAEPLKSERRTVAQPSCTTARATKDEPTRHLGRRMRQLYRRRSHSDGRTRHPYQKADEIGWSAADHLI